MSEEVEKGVRRRSSSILKQPKSPRQALRELENSEPTGKEITQSKQECRSSRRVSFADTCKVQEFCKEVNSYTSGSESHCPEADVHNRFLTSAGPPPKQNAPSILPSHHSMLTGQILYLPLSAVDTSKEGENWNGAALGSGDENRLQASRNRIPLKALNPDELERNNAADCDGSDRDEGGGTELNRTMYMSNDSMELTRVDTGHLSASSLGAGPRTVYFDSRHDEMEMTAAHDFTMYVDERNASDLECLPMESDQVFHPNDGCQAFEGEEPEEVDAETSPAKFPSRVKLDFEGTKTNVQKPMSEASETKQHLFAEEQKDEDAESKQHPFVEAPAAQDEVTGGTEQQDEDMEFTDVENYSIIVSQEDFFRAGRQPEISEKRKIGEVLSAPGPPNLAGRDAPDLLSPNPQASSSSGRLDLADQGAPDVLAPDPRDADGAVSMDLTYPSICTISDSPLRPLPVCSTARDGSNPVRFSISTEDVSLVGEADPRDVAFSRGGDGDPRSMDLSVSAIMDPQDAAVTEHQGGEEAGVPDLSAIESVVFSEHQRGNEDAATDVKSDDRATSGGFGNEVPASQGRLISEIVPSSGAGATVKFEGPSANMELTSCATEGRFPQALRNPGTVMFEGTSADMELSSDCCSADALLEDKGEGSPAAEASRLVRGVEGEPESVASPQRRSSPLPPGFGRPVAASGSDEEAECGNEPEKCIDNVSTRSAEPEEEQRKTRKRRAPPSPQSGVAEKICGIDGREAGWALSGETLVSGERFIGSGIEKLLSSSRGLLMDEEITAGNEGPATSLRVSHLMSLHDSHLMDGESARSPKDVGSCSAVLAAVNKDSMRSPKDIESSDLKGKSCSAMNEDCVMSVQESCWKDGHPARSPENVRDSVLNGKRCSAVNEDSVTSKDVRSCSAVVATVNEDLMRSAKDVRNSDLKGKSCSAVNEDSVMSVRESCRKDSHPARSPENVRSSVLNGKSCSAVNEDSVTSKDVRSCSAVVATVNEDSMRSVKDVRNSDLKGKSCSAVNNDSVMSVRESCGKDCYPARSPENVRDSVLKGKSCSVVNEDSVISKDVRSCSAANEDSVMSVRESCRENGHPARSPENVRNSFMNGKSCSVMNDDSVTSLRANCQKDGNPARSPEFSGHEELESVEMLVIEKSLLSIAVNKAAAVNYEGSVTAPRVRLQKDGDSTRSPKSNKDPVSNDECRSAAKNEAMASVPECHSKDGGSFISDDKSHPLPAALVEEVIGDAASSGPLTAEFGAESPRSSQRAEEGEEESGHPVANSCLRGEDEIDAENNAGSFTLCDPRTSSVESKGSSCPLTEEELRTSLYKAKGSSRPFPEDEPQTSSDDAKGSPCPLQDNESRTSSYKEKGSSCPLTEDEPRTSSNEAKGSSCLLPEDESRTSSDEERGSSRPLREDEPRASLYKAKGSSCLLPEDGPWTSSDDAKGSSRPPQDDEPRTSSYRAKGSLCLLPEDEPRTSSDDGKKSSCPLPEDKPRTSSDEAKGSSCLPEDEPQTYSYKTKGSSRLPEDEPQTYSYKTKGSSCLHPEDDPRTSSDDAKGSSYPLRDNGPRTSSYKAKGSSCPLREDEPHIFPYKAKESSGPLREEARSLLRVEETEGSKRGELNQRDLAYVVPETQSLSGGRLAKSDSTGLQRDGRPEANEVEVSRLLLEKETKGQRRKRLSVEEDRGEVRRKQAAISAHPGDAAAARTLDPSRSANLRLLESSTKREAVRYGFGQEAKPDEPKATTAENPESNDDAAASSSQDERHAGGRATNNDDSFEDLMEISCPTLVSLTETSFFCAAEETDLRGPEAVGAGNEGSSKESGNGTELSEKPEESRVGRKPKAVEGEPYQDKDEVPASVVSEPRPRFPGGFSGALEESSVQESSRPAQTPGPERQRRQPLWRDRLRYAMGTAGGDFRRDRGNVERAEGPLDDGEATERVISPAEQKKLTGTMGASGRKEDSRGQTDEVFRARLTNMVRKISQPRNGSGQADQRSTQTTKAVARKKSPDDFLEQLKTAEQLLNSYGEGKRRVVEAHSRKLESFNVDGLLQQVEAKLKAMTDLKEEVDRLKEVVKGLRVEDVKATEGMEPPAKDRIEREPKRSVAKCDVEEWTSKSIHLSFWRGALQLQFSLGEVILGEELAAEDEETEETKNREVLAFQKWSTLGDVSSDPARMLAHRSMSEAFERENIAATCRSTQRLKQILPTLIVYTEDAMYLYLDVTRAGYCHFTQIQENGEVTIEFVDLDAFLNFKLRFAIEPGTYPNRRLRPEATAIVGQVRNEDLQTVLQAVNVGPSYLYRLVDAVDQWLKSGCSSKS